MRERVLERSEREKERKKERERQTGTERTRGGERVEYLLRPRVLGVYSITFNDVVIYYCAAFT